MENPLSFLDLTKGLGANVLTTTAPTPKLLLPKGDNSRTIMAYSPSFTKLTSIPRRFCMIINSKKQLEAVTIDIDARTNMRLLSYITGKYPHIKELLPNLTFEGLHINSRGIYIDYTEGAGIHILPRTNWRREVIIFDNNEEEVLRETFDSELTITLEKLSLEFEELGLDIDADDEDIA
jgi:hypothetical protein